MLVNIASKPFVIVLLDSLGKYTRIADAKRVKHWLETGDSLALTPVKAVRAVKARAVSRAQQRSHGTLRPRLVKTTSKR
jgi:D-alanyl-D-alanine endopeptidase (penicillin-binding protein 7)